MLLGVLVNNKLLSRIKKGNAPSGLKLLACEAAKAYVPLIIMSPQSINWWSKTVKGFVCYASENEWKVIESPFPDAIYDRATFGAKGRKTGNMVRKRFREEFSIPFLNNKHAFGKWETHRTLSRCLNIRRYLPDTDMYRHPYQLVDFIGKYGTVYVKASNGSLGKEVYKLQQLFKGGYLVGYRENGQNCSERLNLHEFQAKIINGRLAGKKVIIQQGIYLAHFNERDFDIRLLVQKDGNSLWSVIDKAVRVGAPGSVVTNVSSGGEVRKLDEVLSAIFPEKAQKIKQDIDSLALGICSCLENRYGRLCELGMDMALDIYGKLWLLEVNGKPAKVSVRRSQDTKLISKAYSNPVMYFKYLYKHEIIQGNPENEVQSNE